MEPMESISHRTSHVWSSLDWYATAQPVFCSHLQTLMWPHTSCFGLHTTIVLCSTKLCFGFTQALFWRHLGVVFWRLPKHVSGSFWWSFAIIQGWLASSRGHPIFSYDYDQLFRLCISIFVPTKIASLRPLDIKFNLGYIPTRLALGLSQLSPATEEFRNTLVTTALVLRHIFNETELLLCICWFFVLGIKGTFS